ncbi:carboxymuconolactone decarboxylase family protein [Arachnia propionica]|jgi:4-carboxymuconolactone decarboxylase domain/alkylhydroperoxidase ahpD family core domain protein|uniref:carboxymuconolactone decarboxylase family protein n=1 Tax=Arachnia propionica TaxID=1750 RepID=UPI0017F50D4D|nr:carboxymuconolactone decarboxylase family protein [Propionibacterium sp.]
MEYTSTLPLVDDESANPRVKAVFDDIRATRQTDFINNFWRALANDPANLERTWQELKEIMGPGTELDPVIKELIYVAVSTVNNCTYCVRSHTAAARAKGASDAQIAELQSIVAAANKTNRLAIGLQVPIDEVFA